MGGYFVKRPEIGAGQGNADFAALAEEFPAIAWMLAGRPKEHPEGFESPASLIIFFDSGRLKYCISPKVGLGVAFGTVSDPTCLLASIESSIIDGSYEWKNRKRNS